MKKVCLIVALLCFSKPVCASAFAGGVLTSAGYFAAGSVLGGIATLLAEKQKLITTRKQGVATYLTAVGTSFALCCCQSLLHHHVVSAFHGAEDDDTAYRERMKNDPTFQKSELQKYRSGCAVGSLVWSSIVMLYLKKNGLLKK